MSKQYWREREPGDHGTANQAIEFLLWHRQSPGEETEFLRAWQQGDLSEWPEYYDWLAQQSTAGQGESA